MSKRGKTSDIVDNMLKILVTGGVLSVGVLAPNALQALDKPLRFYYKKMDARDREKEIRKTILYMRRQGLLTGSYEHGLQITNKGKARADKAQFDSLTIPKPKKWDKQWRLIFFDIPENKKTDRDAMTRKIKELGFRPLQKSVWIHPYPCRHEVEIVCTNYDVDEFVTYIETSFIDKENKLKEIFKI